uniref:Mitoguardin-1-like n=1 Tax=Sinocyclocheilus grahami TaxID=75366 RepID=A0A672L5J3_SINGR
MTEDLLRNTQVSMKLAALRFMDLPLSVYYSLPQVSLSTGTKKLFVATAFGVVSLIYLARRFRRRKGKKKASSPVEQETFEFLNTVPLKKGKNTSQLTFNQQGDIISVDFIRKLESLLQRAYQLQEEFEGALGMTDPSTHPTSDKHMDLSVREDLEDTCLRDSISIASTDSFVSAAELSEHREMMSSHAVESLYHHPFYEDALQMAEEGKISCRVLRTEMLECLGDTDFLAKLHCIRQACPVILCERATRAFLADTGKKILSSIIVKARKVMSPTQLTYCVQTDHWENTEMELSARGVKHLNFYDIVLDFILMDSFEDLENPPISIQNVVHNRWLNNSFKETAVASSCWSVLKQKRQHMKGQDGFIAHFYAVCEHTSPVLAWGFLGPKSSLHDFCCCFKEQVLFFMKDIFDLDKVRYCTLDTLAEDILHLLHRRSELLLSYLGTDMIRHLNGCSGTTLHLVPSALLEAQVQ